MQDSRLLSILLILSNNKKKLTAKDLANHFEVSVRTIYRDIEKLSMSGVPIASIGGTGGGYYLLENYNVNQWFINKNEAKTFLSVMSSLNRVFGKNKQFNDIVLKLKNTYKEDNTEFESLQVNLSHFSMEHELKEHLVFINQQIESSRLLVFDYINRRMEYERRVTEPIQISFSSGDWFLIAYCLNRDDYRKFKLTRMRKLEAGEFFIKRSISDKALKHVFSESIRRNSIMVTLKFPQKSGFHLTEYFTKEEITETIEDHYIVKASFPNDMGLVHFLLGFGENCEIVEPLSLRTKIKNYLNNMMKIYND